MTVGDAHVFPGFLTPVLTPISFQSHRLLFSHASAEVRGENMPERNFPSTGSRTHIHQVMSPTLYCDQTDRTKYIMSNEALMLTKSKLTVLCYVVNASCITTHLT